MDLADFLPVPEFDLCALLAHEILQLLVLTERTIVVVHTAQVDFAALETVVESCLVEHELDGLLEIGVSLRGDATPFVQTFHAAQRFDHLLYFSSLGFFRLKEVLDKVNVLVRFKLNLLLADRAVHVFKGDAFCLTPIFDTVVNALCMESMTASQGYHRLRLKRLPVADPTHLVHLRILD